METFGAALSEVVERLTTANVFCGHGYESIHDEAVALVLGAARLPPEQTRDLLADPFPEQAVARLSELLRGRCEERVPLAYLLGEAWLAGLCFNCDDRALVPRSPIHRYWWRGVGPGGAHRWLREPWWTCVVAVAAWELLRRMYSLRPSCCSAILTSVRYRWHMKTYSGVLPMDESIA